MVIGGRGNDTALLGAGDDTFVWNPGDGSDTVEGQAGFDTLQFNGAEHRRANDPVGERLPRALHRDVGNVNMDLDSVERVNIKALGGADTVTVNDLTGTGVKESRSTSARPAAAATAQADTVIVNGTKRLTYQRHQRSAARHRPRPGRHGDDQLTWRRTTGSSSTASAATT